MRSSLEDSLEKSVSCAGFKPSTSSPLVERLLAAHGVVLGKTRMHELAVGVTTINMHGGPVLNPYNNVMHTGGLCLCFPTCSRMEEVCQLQTRNSSPRNASDPPPLHLSQAADACTTLWCILASAKLHAFGRSCGTQQCHMMGVCLCREQRRGGSCSCHAHGRCRLLLRHWCSFQYITQPLHTANPTRLQSQCKEFSSVVLSLDGCPCVMI